MKEPNEESLALSRRSFLKGTGIAAVAATGISATLEPAQALAAEETASLGPDAVSISLDVNGRQLKTQVEPRVTLLDCLRDYLDVTGCKRVCDRATCGACTVQVDGKVVYSCTMLAVDAVGKKITTAEGLLTSEKPTGSPGDIPLSKVQEAFWNKDASQCGFCTPGFVVACSAVLAKNPKPSMDEMKRGLDGNICRCGTYEQMAQAIAEMTGGTH